MTYFKIADPNDLNYLSFHDCQIKKQVLLDKCLRKEIMMACIDDQPIGFLRYGYFWDAIPFMNLLFIEEKYRHKGYASALVRYWEETMLKKGHYLLLTSSMGIESAQYFYRKNGYMDCGNLFIETEGVELIFKKALGKED